MVFQKKWGYRFKGAKPPALRFNNHTSVYDSLTPPPPPRSIFSHPQANVSYQTDCRQTQRSPVVVCVPRRRLFFREGFLNAATTINVKPNFSFLLLLLLARHRQIKMHLLSIHTFVHMQSRFFTQNVDT